MGRVEEGEIGLGAAVADDDDAWGMLPGGAGPAGSVGEAGPCKLVRRLHGWIARICMRRL